MSNPHGGAASDYYGGGPNANSNDGYNNQYSGPPNPSYNPNGNPPPNYHPPSETQKYDAKGHGSFDDAFKVAKPKWNDVWAGILFILTFLAFAGLSGYTLNKYVRNFGSQGRGIYSNVNKFGPNTHTFILFAFVIGTAVVVSYIYLFLARKFTKQFIWITGILNILFGLITAIYMLVRRYWSGGIVSLLFVVFAVICFISWIPRIPFSVLMLQTSVDVSKKVGHVYLVSWIGGILSAIFAAWYSFTLVSIYVSYQPGPNSVCSRDRSCSTGKVIGMIVFVTFAMFWISEFIKNMMHTTISGVYGSWYFYPRNIPKGPTRGAFKRAATYSFGSISLGSLIVAFIKAIRQLCSVARQANAQDGSILMSICLCFVGCILDLTTWLAELFNSYAFSHIALYGTKYTRAAKDTWRMIKDRGIDALVNECLIGPVFSMGATFVAYICMLLAYLYLVYTHPAYNRDGSFTPVILAFSFLIGLQICHIITGPITSGIETIFVAMARNPEVMRSGHPELWNEMVKRYPHVLNGIQG